VRSACYEKWLKRELSYLGPKLYIVVGRHAAGYLFPRRDFTQLVFQYLELNRKRAFVLPHPSPANRKWFKENPRFEAQRVYDVRKALHEASQ